MSEMASPLAVPLPSRMSNPSRVSAFPITMSTNWPNQILNSFRSRPAIRIVADEVDVGQVRSLHGAFFSVR